MELREVKPAEFVKFAENCRYGDFLQSVEMYQRYVTRGNEVYLLGLYEGKKMVAASLVVSKRKVLGQKIFNAPRGFLMDYEGEGAEEIFAKMTKEVKKFLRERGAMALVIAPGILREAEVDEKGGVVARKWTLLEEFTKLARRLGYKALGEWEFARWIYTVPMEGKTAEELLAGFRADHKRTIKYATRRYGVRLRMLREDELDIVDAMEKETGQRNGFVDPGMDYYREMKAAYGDKVQFVVAEAPRTVIEAFDNNDKEGMERALAEANQKLGEEIWLEKEPKGVEMSPLATAMLVYWGDEVICLYSGSKGAYKKLGGPHLIRYGVMKQALEQGLHYYNFYHVLPQVGDGVYEFKRGFRGVVKEYIGTFILPITWRGKIFAAKQKYTEMRNVR